MFHVHHIYVIWNTVFSKNEAKDVVAGLKRLERENLCKAHLELTSRLSNIKLGPTGSSQFLTSHMMVTKNPQNAHRKCF